MTFLMKCMKINFKNITYCKIGNITGFVNKNEKVKLLAKGEINSIIQYGVDKKIYKVGIVPTKSIKKL